MDYILETNNLTKIYGKKKALDDVSIHVAKGDIYVGEDNTINVHVSNIRKKIKKYTDTEYIETVWGIGFKLKK